MRILFFSMGYENLGVEYLSAVLQRAGHTVGLIHEPALFQDKNFFDSVFLGRIFTRRKQIIKDAILWKADLLCFSVLTDTYQWALGIARELKKEVPAPVIFGGMHPTSVPEKVIKDPAVDMICLGEGEEALSEYAKTKGTDIRNIWFKEGVNIIRNPVRPLIKDIDSLPLPAKDLYSFYDYKRQYMVMTTRGCPFNCSYCSNSVLYDLYGPSSRKLRRRSPSNVIEELRWAKEKYHLSDVTFIDDVFGDDRKWLLEFSELYKRHIALPFRCHGHVNLFDDELARTLKEMRCSRVKFGIQTLNRKTRREVMLRYETNRNIDEALTACEEAGLPYYVDHIFTSYDSQRDHIRAALYYSKKKYLKKIVIYNLSYFPGTPLLKGAVERGRLSEKEIDLIEDGIGQMYYKKEGVDKEKTFGSFITYGSLYRLIPMLHYAQVKACIRLGAHSFLGKIPESFLVFLDIIVLLAKRDRVARSWLISMTKNYLTCFFKKGTGVTLPGLRNGQKAIPG
jgi:radical SAM superfamily enzyme YgiQ (UPF0313 family)